MCINEKNDIVLSKRLKMVADMVSDGNITADVGCDHGFVSIYLIRTRQCSKVIAMDINIGPLQRATEHVLQYGMSKYIEIRQSDGVAALKCGEADSMIAAGMGGRLIIKILENGYEKISSMKEIILQPQSEIFRVRQFLNSHRFKIVQEEMIYEDGKYYPIIKVKPDAECGLLQDYEEWYGPLLIKSKHPVLLQYLLNEKQKYETILFTISNLEKKDQAAKENLDTVKERLNMINQILNIIL